jgi:hypothetical protein
MSALSRLPLSLRIGGIGHRPNRLPLEQGDAIEEQFATLLYAIRQAATGFQKAHGEFFAEQPVQLSAVTSLAEGGDRLFAQAAIRLGYALSCVLPFAQKRFEDDFSQANSLLPDRDSLAEFRALLQSAREGGGLTLFELDGERQAEDNRYQPAARTVLNQADLLFVVWDGERETRPGGTYATILEALASSIPVVWMPSQQPDNWCLLRTAQDLDTPPSAGNLAVLAAVVNSLLELPQSQDRLAQFINEAPATSGWSLWQVFRAVLGWRWRGAHSHSSDKPAEEGADTLPATITTWLEQNIEPHYRRADALARCYGDRYRSAFLQSYALGVVAVFLALIPLGAGWTVADHLLSMVACAVLELGIVLYIGLLVRRGNRQRWHQRWLEYRLVAELLRQQRLLLPLGSWRSIASNPAHLLQYGTAEGTWMYWYVRNISRTAGVPNAVINDDYLQGYCAEVRGLVEEQWQFHEHCAERDERIEHRLHRTGLVLFAVTAAIIAVHAVELMLEGMRGAEGVAHGTHWMAVLCALLPATGAAFAAINNQGEFNRIAKRAQAMERRFGELREQTAQWGDSVALSSTTLLLLAHQISQMMVAEVLDWRVVLLDRPLVMPA